MQEAISIIGIVVSGQTVAIVTLFWMVVKGHREIADARVAHERCQMENRELKARVKVLEKHAGIVPASEIVRRPEQHDHCESEGELD